MKYILLLIATLMGFNSCTHSDSLVINENQSGEAIQLPYRFQVQIGLGADITIDSCLIKRDGSVHSLLLLKGENLIFDESRVSQLFAVQEAVESLDFTFYVKRGQVNSYSESVTVSNLSGKKLYTWILDGEEGLELELSITPWQEGGTIITGPDEFAYKLDLANSQLPDYVRISATADTLFVPSCQTELLIALDANVETVWMSQGADLEVNQVIGLDYLGNRFRLNLKSRGLLAERTVTKLFFAEKGEGVFDEKPLVIVQEAARLEVLSDKATILGNNVAYSSYVDGTLACVKEGYSVQSYTINSDSPASYEWIVMQRRGGQFYVEGGFKPNDSEAYGQLQTSRITIEYSDGVEEEYAFTRHRLALPVVKFGAHYWSKFNMRGNSKGYEDQIGFDLDRPDMWSYLKNCDGNAFIAYAGSQYCGTNPEGLDMEKNSTGGFSYQGYPEEFGSTTINDIQIDSHCPAGYQVPTEEEMKMLIGGSVVSLVELSTMQEYQNAYLVNRERYTVDRHRRGNIVKSGITIPNVYHLKITNLQGQEMVMHGVGYQSEANAINYGYWLYAAVSDGKDQAGFNNNRNNFYMQAHSGKKTVSVRCIKSPVHYIIE